MESPKPNGLSQSDERTWATFAHLGLLVGLIVPLGTVLTPLVIWLINKDKSSVVDHHGKEALNFQLTMLVGFVVGFILMFIYIGFLVLAAIFVVNLVFSILAAVAANKGEEYKYPFSLRMVN